jgi:hypothetical protein
MKRRKTINQKSTRRQPRRILCNRIGGNPTNEHHFDFLYANRLLSTLPPTEFRFTVILTMGLLFALLSAPICLAVQTTPDSLELAQVDRYLSNQLEEIRNTREIHTVFADGWLMAETGIRINSLMSSSTIFSWTLMQVLLTVNQQNEENFVAWYLIYIQPYSAAGDVSGFRGCFYLDTDIVVAVVFLMGLGKLMGGDIAHLEENLPQIS